MANVNGWKVGVREFEATSEQSKLVLKICTQLAGNFFSMFDHPHLGAPCNEASLASGRVKNNVGSTSYRYGYLERDFQVSRKCG